MSVEGRMLLNNIHLDGKAKCIEGGKTQNQMSEEVGNTH